MSTVTLIMAGKVEHVQLYLLLEN